MPLYFVTARRGWDTVFGGHWIANSPKHAIELAKATIELAKATIDTNPLMSRDDGMIFTAKKSKADPAAMAINA